MILNGDMNKKNWCASCPNLNVQPPALAPKMKMLELNDSKFLFLEAIIYIAVHVL